MNTYRVFEIAAEIKNPEPDRRSKDWHKLPTVPAGSRFLISETSIQESKSRYAWTGPRTELGKLIVAQATPAEPRSVRELSVVHGCDWSGEEILRIMLKLGRITPADFAAVADVPEDF